MKRRSLPQFVTAFCDRHGKERLRFRRAGFRGGYFTATPPQQAFWEEYGAFMGQVPPEPVPAHRVAPGSIDDLMPRYYRSTDFRGNAIEVTLTKRRAVLEAFRAKHGHRPVKTATYQGLDNYIAAVAAGDGNRGGPFAAETARKEIKRLFAYAVKLAWRPDNPMVFVSFRPAKTSGFHSWTEAEIAQYRDRWSLGTKQRAAMELILWTGKRRGDAIRLGPQHIEGGKLKGRDQKTGKAWELPIAPQLRTALDAMPSAGHLCFVPSDRGKPYTAASFGNMFRQWCNDAGLPHCSAHGLRKAISRRMAESGISNSGIKSVTLHSSDSEVAIYTAAADQKRLAVTSIAEISDWEMSNLNGEVRHASNKSA